MRHLLFSLVLLMACNSSADKMQKQFTYGYHYQGRLTDFLLPVADADKVQLNLYADATTDSAYVHWFKVIGADDSTGLPLWGLRLRGDLVGKYYTLQIWRNGQASREFLDPWSRSNTNTYGRGLILADDTPIGKGPELAQATDAIIYEVHVRDFSIDSLSGMAQRGKYLAFTETGTRLATDKEIKTGIDHLIELGINVVQLLPIQDFDNDEIQPTYNWGYMPVNFNSPEGWYATGLVGSERVVELKKLIDALHRAGIRVHLDVVYNHTAENAIHNPWSFELLAPRRFYRLQDDGSYWNGSGCGNEFNSEYALARQFIVESCLYWVREYDIDGFRFDLMGLIDRQTMRAVVDELRQLKTDIQVYGEPWTAGPTPIATISKGVQRNQGYGVFNDHFRDAIKGSVFNLEPGFVQAGLYGTKVKAGIRGSIDDFAAHPGESINYVASHDNHTFWDRLTLSQKETPLDEIEAMNKLGAALVLTAQGVPFIHAGQEFLRSKFGHENSYNAPDSINMMRWQLKREHNDIFSYYRGLIHLRKGHAMFRMTHADSVRKYLRFLDDDLGLEVPANVIAWQIEAGNSGDSWQKVVMIANANRDAVSVPLPVGEYRLFVNRQRAAEIPISENTYSAEVQISGLEFLLLAY
jgi:pullulanase